MTVLQGLFIAQHNKTTPQHQAHVAAVRRMLMEIDADANLMDAASNPLRDLHELANDTVEEFVYILSPELIGATHTALLEVDATFTIFYLF